MGCCCQKKGPPQVEPDDGCCESFLDFIILGRRRDRRLLMERRRLQKWKRVEELRHQDYLIAGGIMESKKRMKESENIFEYRRDDIDRIYPEICDNCCEMKDDPDLEEYASCEEIWHDIPLEKLNYEYIYDCVMKHNLMRDQQGGGGGGGRIQIKRGGYKRCKK